jgi:polysaccharide export outer membrane protein
MKRSLNGMRSFLLAGAAVLCAGAATPQVQTGAGTGPNLPVQEIGANDLIAISVYDAPEFTRTIRVGSTGEIALPMLRRKLRAEGLLPDALESSIAQALEAEHILVDPVVTITIMEYNSRPISVVGAVHKPVTFQASGPVTLIDAITRAEGLSPDAGSEILITRTRTDPNGLPSKQIERISVKGLINEADVALNPLLIGGEQVRVPEIGKVFVVGNVHKPGAFRVEDSSGTSVLKVLALSEGLLAYTSPQAFIYRHIQGSTTPSEIPLALNKIMSRKAPDVPLEPNDILYIPESKGQRITATTLERLSGFGASTVTGLIVWH